MILNSVITQVNLLKSYRTCRFLQRNILVTKSDKIICLLLLLINFSFKNRQVPMSLFYITSEGLKFRQRALSVFDSINIPID